MKLPTISFYLSLALLMPAEALAHIGHVGEMAGHGHLIGLGALVAAAALAAAMARLRGRKAEDEEEEPVDEAETA